MVYHHQNAPYHKEKISKHNKVIYLLDLNDHFSNGFLIIYQIWYNLGMEY